MWEPRYCVCMWERRGEIRGVVRSRGCSGKVTVGKIGCSLPEEALDTKLWNLNLVVEFSEAHTE